MLEAWGGGGVMASFMAIICKTIDPSTYVELFDHYRKSHEATRAVRVIRVSEGTGGQGEMGRRVYR